MMQQPTIPKQFSTSRVLLAVLWPVGAIFLSGALIGILISGLAGVIPGLRWVENSSSPAVSLTINALLYSTTLAFITLFFYKYIFGNKNKRQVFGLIGRFKLKTLGLFGLAFGAYLITSSLVTTLAGSFLPFVDLNQPQQLGIKPTTDTLQLITIFTMLVVVPPIAEELLFRGYMFQGLREQLSFWPAAILVSLVFGIAHGQWNVGIDTFVLSIFLCALREYTGSIWATMLLHAAKNMLAFSLIFLFPEALAGLQ